MVSTAGKKKTRKVELQGQADALRKESEELAERLRYMQADFENYKKHLDKQKEAFEKSANEGLVKELLTVVDDLESAVEKNKNDEANKGIELILRNLKSVLEKRGLKEIDCSGTLDPYYHEAMMSEPSDKEEGTILSVLQKGYTLNGSVIRHSKVKVSKKKG